LRLAAEERNDEHVIVGIGVEDRVKVESEVVGTGEQRTEVRFRRANSRRETIATVVSYNAVALNDKIHFSVGIGSRRAIQHRQDPLSVVASITVGFRDNFDNVPSSES
jgi:hypothetical protein